MDAVQVSHNMNNLNLIRQVINLFHVSVCKEVRSCYLSKHHRIMASEEYALDWSKLNINDVDSGQTSSNYPRVLIYLKQFHV